jgi:hypothetical protein
VGEDECLDGVEVDADVSAPSTEAHGVLDGDADEALGERAELVPAGA